MKEEFPFTDVRELFENLVEEARNYSGLMFA